MDVAASHADVRRSSSPTTLELCVIAALEFAASWAGMALANETGGAAAIWVANAILLAFVLNYPRRQWATVLATSWIANVAAGVALGHDFGVSVALTACNVIEVLAVALPLRAMRLHRNFARPLSLIVFYILAVGPAPAMSALLAAGFLHMRDHVDFIWSGLNWYSGDALGLAIFVPPLLTVRPEAMRALFRRDQIARTTMLVAAMVVAIVINFFAREYPLAFLFFPAVLLLTFQLSFEGGAIGMLLAGGYMLIPVLVGDGRGGLRGHSLREQILIVEVFIAVIGFSVVLVGAALEERRKLERGLAAAITRAENSREEALVAKDAAENASRMKSTFLATMSHELRTPLNAVIGFSEVMNSEMYGPLGDARYREYTGLIQGAGQHLLELINDILDMSKIEAGRHELNRTHLDLVAVVRDCLSMMAERASQSEVALLEDLPSSPVWLDADPRAMKQILLNLLSNAVKFTPAGGRVTTRVTLKDSCVALSVIDTGVGIPADQIYLLGNPFVQLRNDAGKTHAGTGLGLALVRSLAQMHNGTLRIESAEHVGTTVTVELPAAQAAIRAA
jgi:signal transduction histidine kinase